MAVTGTAVASRVRSTLLDADGIFWSDAEILDALNAAMRAIVMHRPAAYARTEAFTLAWGIEQTLPAGAEMLLDVRSNVDGSSGQRVEFAPVRQIDRRMLDEARPGWMSESGPLVKHFVYDPRTPRVFLVWPRPTTPTKIMCSFSYAPPPVLDMADEIPLSTLYEPAIHDFICATLLMRNSSEGNPPNSGDVSRANVFMTSFATLIGWRSRSTASSSATATPEA